jgi:hypothetical protein
VIGNKRWRSIQISSRQFAISDDMERAALRSGDRTTFDIAHKARKPGQPWLAAAQETCHWSYPDAGIVSGLSHSEDAGWNLCAGGTLVVRLLQISLQLRSRMFKERTNRGLFR